MQVKKGLIEQFQSRICATRKKCTQSARISFSESKFAVAEEDFERKIHYEVLYKTFPAIPIPLVARGGSSGSSYVITRWGS